MDLERRLNLLEEENDVLQARIDELEQALSGGVVLPVEWGLTAQETRVFGVLLVRELATKLAVMTALYGGRDEAQIKIVDVFVCKMRKKLSRFGIEIRTRWGQGYYLDPEIRQSLRGGL